jgi:hypothetical protein
MAKVKLPFFVRIAVHNMPNGKGNVTPVKNGIQLQKKYPKEERWPGKANRLLRAKPQSL